MTMKLMKKVVAGALALFMVAAGVMIAPEAVKADVGPGFELGINVVDQTDGMHVGGILVPQMVVKFRLVPEVTSLPSGDTRYDNNRGNFPDGNNVSDTKVIEYDYKTSTYSTSGADGEAGCYLVQLENIPELAEGTATWGANSKVYRYHLNMVAIYRTDSSGDAITSVNYLNSGDLITAPKSTEILMDVYIGSTGKIESTVLWDKAGSDKITGFAAPTMRGRAAGPSGASNSISYNVYDLEVSTDYIGLASNRVDGKVMYNVVLENVPEYLTRNQTTTDMIKNAIVCKNKDSWAADTTSGNTDLSNDRVVFRGALASNDKIVFAGMPIEGANGYPINFSAGIDYKNVTDLTGANVKDLYKDAIYFGSHVERIDGSIDSMDAFVSTAYASAYDYSEGTGYVKQTALINMVPSSSTSDNNVRFVVFDPSELVIVGVTVSALPGVIAILAAVAGLVVFVVVRRKNRVRY